MSHGGRIAILSGHSKVEEFSTIVHELADEMLHKAERRTATTRLCVQGSGERVSLFVPASAAVVGKHEVSLVCGGGSLSDEFFVIGEAANSCGESCHRNFTFPRDR
jgi:hypothetical protein